MAKKTPPKGTKSWYKYHCMKKAMELALIRDDYTCQVCGKKKGQAQIQASHVYSVHVHDYLQADVENIKALCSYHHRWWWHSSPMDAADWFNKEFPERSKNLKQKTIDKIVPDWEYLLQELKSELSKTVS